MPPISAATARFRWHHRQAARPPTIRRARIGRPSRNRCRSSASAAAVAYAGRVSRHRLVHDRLQVRRDRGSSLRSRGGSSCVTWRISSVRSFSSNAGRSASSS